MLIEDYIVEVAVCHKTMKHYKSLGYDLPTKIGKTGKEVLIQGAKIKVKAVDLTVGSNVYVKAKCDYCGKIYDVAYNNYNASRKKGVEKDACKDCIDKKREDNVLLKYGVKGILQVREYKEKAEQTLMNNYGVKYPGESKEIREKVEKTCKERYGVSNPFKSKEVQEKIKKTNIVKYGVPYVSQSDLIKEKVKKTCLEKYGVEYSLQSEVIRNKGKDTMMKKYGVVNAGKSDAIKNKRYKTNIERYGTKIPSMCEEVKNKIKKTTKERYGYECVFDSPAIKSKINNIFRKKYGVDYPLQSPIIQEKVRKSLGENGTQCTSRPQRYINKLYNGQLNYPISKFFADIFIDDYNCCIEYDGGGHDLKVKFGKITQEEFERRELIRNRIVKQSGYRLIRIISPTDKLPSDEILLQMLHEALEYFNATNHTWRQYYVEEGIMKDAEHKDGIEYDYGTLWNAKTLANQDKSA